MKANDTLFGNRRALRVKEDLVLNLALVIAHDLMPAIEDPKVHDTAQLASEWLLKINGTPLSDMTDLWAEAAHEFGFELDDNEDDCWMCMRLNLLDRACIDP